MSAAPVLAAAGPPALRVEGIVKQFAGVRALDGVTLDVARGSVHALLGGNGSGKSTLIKALAGIQPADEGQVTINGRVSDLTDMTPRIAQSSGVRFVHQASSVFPVLTVAENMAMGHGWQAGATRRIHWREQNSRAAQILKRFNIDIDPKSPLGAYNMATQTMVAVARAMQDIDEAGVLVLDEPTSAFPPAQVDLLLAFVRDFARQGHSVLYVTHRLDEVVRVGDSATILRDGRVGTVLAAEEITHARLSSAIMGPAAESVLTRWEKEVSTAPVAASVRGLTGGPVVDATFDLRPGEIVGVAGLLGSGRSTLLKMIFGVMAASAGSVSLDGAVIDLSSPRRARENGIAYIPENRAEDAAFEALTVTENLGMAATREFFRKGRLDHGAEAAAARDLLADFRVKAPSAVSPLATLSGGNQQKVILARWLRRHPRLILLDEPTQGVDVGARAEIWQLIRRASREGACVLVVTSDLDEMAAFCDRAIVMRAGRIVGEMASHEMNDRALETKAFGMEDLS